MGRYQILTRMDHGSHDESLSIALLAPIRGFEMVLFNNDLICDLHVAWRLNNRERLWKRLSG